MTIAQTRSAGLSGDRSRSVARRLALPLALAMASAIVAGSGAGLAQRPVVLAVVNVKVVALGYRISELIGRPVTNPAGESIGRIDDFIVQRDRVLMAIISVGGFLGIGDRKIAIPYSSLVVSSNRILLPGATRAAVGRLPEFKYR
jgi:sporulation protein YlmC with PRC-barrel domain